ncbi:udp-glycosyltransferase 87a1 [Quercus suber]|uniref:Udp-glycosyltransferase 87a1 n=1 Tax=Quercus suber TaxID=58331 RepID=A0AAW0JA19_QUESU
MWLEITGWVLPTEEEMSNGGIRRSLKLNYSQWEKSSRKERIGNHSTSVVFLTIFVDYKIKVFDCSLTSTPDLTRVTHLVLDPASYSVPVSITNLSLDLLDLSHNSLIGFLPNSVYSLSNLRRLDLSYNKLTGSLPPNLLELALKHNSLSEYLSNSSFDELTITKTHSQPDNIRFDTILNVIPSELVHTVDVYSFTKATRTKLEAPFVRLLDQLEPPAVGVGNQRNIPVASFWPIS